LDQSYVSFTFFDAELDGPSALYNVHLAAFTGDVLNPDASLVGGM